MGRLFSITLEGSLYSCKYCKTHLALSDDIISKTKDPQHYKCPVVFCDQSFHCKHGRAYLFDKVVNVTVGEKVDRMMITGLHTVGDICCIGCGSIVGWKYLAAHEESQKYKEGKIILERFMVLGPDGSQYIPESSYMGGSDSEDG